VSRLECPKPVELPTHSTVLRTKYLYLCLWNWGTQAALGSGLNNRDGPLDLRAVVIIPLHVENH
jgi:hypothetical protein